MSQEQTEKKLFGLTPAEYDDFKAMLRYGAFIVSAVGITFLVVAVGSSLLAG